MIPPVIPVADDKKKKADKLTDAIGGAFGLTKGLMMTSIGQSFGAKKDK